MKPYCIYSCVWLPLQNISLCISLYFPHSHCCTCFHYVSIPFIHSPEGRNLNSFQFGANIAAIYILYMSWWTHTCSPIGYIQLELLSYEVGVCSFLVGNTKEVCSIIILDTHQHNLSVLFVPHVYQHLIVCLHLSHSYECVISFT